MAKSKKREILMECGFSPEQINIIAKYGLIDKALESAHGPVPYEFKELLGMRGS